MKRVNPLLTANNPAPIPGWPAPEGCSAQWCGPLDLSFTHTHTHTHTHTSTHTHTHTHTHTQHGSFTFRTQNTWWQSMVNRAAAWQSLWWQCWLKSFQIKHWHETRRTSFPFNTPSHHPRLITEGYRRVVYWGETFCTDEYTQHKEHSSFIIQNYV
jgi:hypothetical protein